MNDRRRGFVFGPTAAVSVLAALTAAVRYARGECWDTGCQPDSWLVKGCEEYDGMTEIKRAPCSGRSSGTAAGHVYTCCYQRNSIDPSRPLCRATECVSNSSTAAVGCSRHGGGAIEVERSRCAGGGYAYFCCDDPSPADDAARRLNRTGHLTYYSLGLTACGRVYADGDMVAAVAFDHFTTPNPNLDPVCGRRAKIVDPTTLKHVVVTVRDKCEGCKTNDIDVSPSAFEQIRPKAVGRVKVVWDFI